MDSEATPFEAALAKSLGEALANTVNNIEPDKVLTAEEVGEMLSRSNGKPVNERTVIRLAKNGQLPGLNLGQGIGWRFSQRGITAALRGETKPGVA